MTTNIAEGRGRGRRRTDARLKDRFAGALFIACACLSVVAVFGIVGFILYDSIPAFREIGLAKFLFGTVWNPSYDKFGILPMIVNSVIVTVFSVTLGGIVGVFTACFLVFWCPDRFHFSCKGNRFLARLAGAVNKINLRTVFDQIIKLLAGIPSIVYGLFGLEVIVSMLSAVNGGGNGKGILACSLLLAIMILPTVTSLTKNALEAVPESYFEGALALGNTKAQAVFRVVLPAARSGIVSALILALGRAVGEAMAVIWVSGNRVLFPEGLFSNIRTLSTNIVMEMGYATEVHQNALFATGFVLLVFVLLITLSLNLVPKEFRGKRGRRRLRPRAEGGADRAGEERAVYRKRGLIPEILKFMSIAFSVLVILILLAIIVFILSSGLGKFTAEFLSGRQTIDVPTLWPAVWATLELIAITLVIALPLGIGAAIYLSEYAKPGSRLVKIIRTFIDTLSGVPSIVFGLFGMLLFRNALGLGYSVFAGAFTMVFVVLPTVIRSTEESLRAVPLTLREASYGLGAGKVRTIFRIVLPSAFPGIATASILAIGRIIGESAALIFTMGMVFTFSGNPASTGSTLSVLLYFCANEGHYIDQAYATAVILLLMTFLLNLTVYFIQRRVKNKR